MVLLNTLWRAIRPAVAWALMMVLQPRARDLRLVPGWLAVARVSCIDPVRLSVLSRVRRCEREAIKPRCQKDVAFANTTYVEEVRIAVKGASGITSIAQLNGKNVATPTGTTWAESIFG